jgi:hypothetical protein
LFLLCNGVNFPETDPATFSPSAFQPTNRRLWQGQYDRAGRAAQPAILAFHPIIGRQTVVQKSSNIRRNQPAVGNDRFAILVSDRRHIPPNRLRGIWPPVSTGPERAGRRFVRGRHVLERRDHRMNSIREAVSSKIPQVTLGFWIIKIAATTLGETGGDALSMTMNLGYVISSAIFFAFFIVTVASQVAARSFHPFLYWAVIVATTTLGTTMADYADRSLGVGYIGGSLTLFVF